jgi:hypothetical protein
MHLQDLERELHNHFADHVDAIKHTPSFQDVITLGCISATLQWINHLKNHRTKEEHGSSHIKQALGGM